MPPKVKALNLVSPNAAFGIGCAAAILYVVLSPRFCNSLWRPLLFHPHPFEPGTENPPSIDGIRGENVFFSVLGQRRLNGWYYAKPGASRTILFNHGNAGNISYRLGLVQLMLAAGSSVFVYDYASFGLSQGQPSLEGIVDDGTAAYDFLIERGVDPKSIIVYGESLGAAVAMQVSARRQCLGVVLQSGFSSLRRIAQEVFPLAGFYPSMLLPTQQLDTRALLSKPHPPILIIHGRLDEIVPYKHGEDLFATAVGKKTLLSLPATAHNDISMTARDEYVAALREFMLSPAEATVREKTIDG